MAAKKLSRIKQIPAGFISQLGLQGIMTCQEFLTRNPLELMDILDVTYYHLQCLVSVVSSACAPPSKTVLAMQQQRALSGNGFLSTSLLSLDLFLKGGIPPCTVTEISGPPGCGKTQFCIMLSVHSALPLAAGGCGLPVIYIDTEGAFSAERLIEMAECHISLHATTSSQAPPPFPPLPDTRFDLELGQDTNKQNHLEEFANNVHIYKTMTCRSFLECLEGLDAAIASKGAGLVVVDSIASLVRKEFDMTTRRGAMERTALLLKQSARLRYLAETCNVKVIVTNQIVTKLSHDEDRWREASEVDRDRGVITSALGNAWYHSVNTRLLLGHGEGRYRELTIAKSPLCQRSTISVSIEKSGFCISPDSESRLYTSSAGPTLPSRGFSVEFPGQLPLNGNQ